MTGHVQALLSEWLDGTLPPKQHAQVEKHLGTCLECRRLAEDLRTVVRSAGELTSPEPGRDLWPEVQAALKPRVQAPGITRLHPGSALSHGPAATPTRRRIRLSGFQALAAGLACAFLGGAAVSWGAAPRGAGQAAQSVEPAAIIAVADADLPATLMEELRELELALAALEGELSEETAAVLRKNLDLIDRALSDSRAALAGDPSDPYLREHLEGIAQRKASLMRTAVRANGPQAIGP